MLTRFKVALGVTAGAVVTSLFGATAALAQTTSTIASNAVTQGDAGLSTGVDAMTQFLYSALPILIGLAVAAAVVRWVFRRVTGGAH